MTVVVKRVTVPARDEWINERTHVRTIERTIDRSFDRWKIERTSEWIRSRVRHNLTAFSAFSVYELPSWWDYKVVLRLLLVHCLGSSPITLHLMHFIKVVGYKADANQVCGTRRAPFPRSFYFRVIELPASCKLSHVSVIQISSNSWQFESQPGISLYKFYLRFKESEYSNVEIQGYSPCAIHRQRK